MKIIFRLTIIIDVQPDGYHLVTCKELPELLTGGLNFEEAKSNVLDAFVATLEIYEYAKRLLPEEIVVDSNIIDKPPEPLFKTIAPQNRPKKDSSHHWIQLTLPHEDNRVYAA